MTVQPRQGDVFPPTLSAYIDECLGRGEAGRLEVNRHIMQVYQWPLKVYFMGTRDRWLGDPDEMVAEFFADRLNKPAYFTKWRASGLRLRQWLINGFCFFLKEKRRERFKAPSTGVSAGEDREDEDPTPSVAFDRMYIVSLVRGAMKRTQEICEGEGLGTHFEVFYRHFYQDRAYTEFAEELGVDAPRAAVMARTARGKFQGVLREMVKCEGCPDVDDEIRTLLEA